MKKKVKYIANLIWFMNKFKPFTKLRCMIRFVITSKLCKYFIWCAIRFSSFFSICFKKLSGAWAPEKERETDRLSVTEKNRLLVFLKFPFSFCHRWWFVLSFRWGHVFTFIRWSIMVFSTPPHISTAASGVYSLSLNFSFFLFLFSLFFYFSLRRFIFIRKCMPFFSSSLLFVCIQNIFSIEKSRIIIIFCCTLHL